MPKYTILFTKTAEKQLRTLPNIYFDSIIETIQSLADNPRPLGVKKLKGRNAYRIRKGDLQVIAF